MAMPTARLLPSSSPHQHADDSTLAVKIFEGLFIHQDALKRHLTAPMLAERATYLSRLIDVGRDQKIIKEIASMVCHLVHLGDSAASRIVDDNEIAFLVEKYLSEKRPGKMYSGESEGRHFKSAARCWFRFLGSYASKPSTLCVFEKEFADFTNALSVDLGYLPSTVVSWVNGVRPFLVWAGNEQKTLRSISLNDIDFYFAERAAAGIAPRTIKGQSQALRVFFRYAESRGWHESSLSRTISAPYVRTQRSAPKCPTWKQVRRVLSSLDDSNPSHCRAKAILLLASVYGLRRSEITRLTLDDLDWYNEVLTVRRSKRGRIQQFPLLYEVGESLIRYLKSVRPFSKHRHIFLTLQRPYRPAENIGPAMRQVIGSTGIINGACGMHALRHACATELLRRGSSLRSIADFLGHRSIRSVSVYAHSDHRALRQVADFCLKDVL